MEKLQKISYIVISVIGGGVILFLFFKHLFLLVSPFLIAWAIAFLMRAPAARLCRKIKIPVRVMRVLLSSLIATVFLGLISLGVWALISELGHLLSSLESGGTLRALIDRLTSGGIFGGILDSLGDTVGDAFYNFLMSIASTLGTSVSSWIGAIPRVLLFIVVTVIATVYFSLDLERVNAAASRLLPRAVYNWLVTFKRGFFSIGLRYIRAYLTLMLVTFSVILVGLLFLGRRYALLLSFIIAFLDLLPVIGVSTVLVPWSLYEIVFADRTVGIGLIILLVLHELIRQFCEPKIIGENLGVHPIVTLAVIYIGYSLFGFVGLLLVPIATVLIDISLGKENSTDIKRSATPKRD